MIFIITICFAYKEVTSYSVWRHQNDVITAGQLSVADHHPKWRSAQHAASRGDDVRTESIWSKINFQRFFSTWFSETIKTFLLLLLQVFSPLDGALSRWWRVCSLTSSLRTLTTRSRRFIRSLVMKSSSLKLFTMTSLRDKIRRMSPFRRPRRRKSISPQQISELAAACSTAVENDDVFVSPPPPPRPKPITTQSSAKRSRQRTPMASSSVTHRKSSSRSKKVRSVTPLTITDDITTSMTSRKSLVKSCEAAVTSSTTSEVIKPKKRSTPVTSSVERVSSEEDSRVTGKVFINSKIF